MENLPAEIILLIFRNIYSRDEIETLQHITRIGAVNKFIHQVELKFWKQRLIDRTGSRLSGVLRKVKSPKMTYLGNYFGCTQCGQFAIFRCRECPNLGCGDCCVNGVACECGPTDDIYWRLLYTCPDHKGGWRCHQCTAPICGDCFKMCWMCQNTYCEKCIYTEEGIGNHCGDCYLPFEDPEIGVHVVPYMTELPSELLLSIFQLIFGDVSIPLIDRVKLVTRFGATSNVLRAVENYFWINVMNQTCGSWLQIKLKSFYFGAKERSRVFFAMDLTNMPIKLRDNPKEVYLYGKFSCQQCGKKRILNECKRCGMNVCSFCGHQRQCQCHEFFEEDDFLCYYCHYKCTTCQRDLCLRCCGLCRICRRFYCFKCHSKEHKTGTLLLHEEWGYASHIEEEDFSNSSYYSDSDDLIGTCIQCGDEIYDEEDLGHCPSCEYYNEINSYKLCNKCIGTCQICYEQYCTNCMIMYHEPCEQWKMCPSCKSEVSQLLQCVECSSDTCCEFCLQDVERACQSCGKQKPDPMQID